MYVNFPGKSTWDLLYVVLKDSEMQFMKDVKHHAFSQTYVINRAEMRKTKKYIAIPNEKNPQKVEL